VTVVLAAEGYPDAPVGGAVIKGLDRIGPHTLLFHAGTSRDGRQVRVSGGRVLAVVGIGDDLGSARSRAYDGVAEISWPGMVYRTDIGAQAPGLRAS
jgi:phosphoribosylamine--glycine ligase